MLPGNDSGDTVELTYSLTPPKENLMSGLWISHRPSDLEDELPSPARNIPVAQFLPQGPPRKKSKALSVLVVCTVALLAIGGSVYGTIEWIKSTTADYVEEKMPEKVAKLDASNAAQIERLKTELAAPLPQPKTIYAKSEPAAKPVKEPIQTVIPDDPRQETPKPPKVIVDSGKNRTPIEPRPKPAAAVEEANQDKPADTIQGIVAGEKASAEQHKPLFLWIACTPNDNELTKQLHAGLGDAVVHCLTGQDGTEADEAGPRVRFKGQDGRTYFVRQKTFSPSTADKIKTRLFPKPEGMEIKFPQADPPMAVRHHNTPKGGGQCYWAAIDTLAEFHGYKTDLMKTHIGSPDAVSDGPHLLSKMGIRSQYTNMGWQDWRFLQEACNKGYGATVGIFVGYVRDPESGMTVKMGHELNLVGITKDKVALIDNNDPKLATVSVSRQEFGEKWDGSAIVILPKDGDKIPTVWKQGVPIAGLIKQDKAPNRIPQRELEDTDMGAFGIPTFLNSVPLPSGRCKYQQFYSSAPPKGKTIEVPGVSGDGVEIRQVGNQKIIIKDGVELGELGEPAKLTPERKQEVNQAIRAAGTQYKAGDILPLEKRRRCFVCNGGKTVMIRSSCCTWTPCKTSDSLADE